MRDSRNPADRNRLRSGQSSHGSLPVQVVRGTVDSRQDDHSIERDVKASLGRHTHGVRPTGSSSDLPWSSTPTYDVRSQLHAGPSRYIPVETSVPPTSSAAIVTPPTDDDDDVLMERVARLLTPTDAPDNDLAFFSDKRVNQRSCQWIEEDETMKGFLKDDADVPRILWCFGVPGCGKSVTASYIIEYLLEASKPCAYYYFRSGNHANNALGSFLSTVAFQLAKHLPSYRQRLSALAEHRLDVGKTGHKLLWKKLFGTGLFESEISDPIYVVIDGLDELSQNKELLQKMFLELDHVVCPIRILLVSRPTTEIEMSIDKLSRQGISVQRLSIDNNAGDLRMYVSGELSSMLGNDQFKLHTMEEVLNKANGNFLWAHLVVEELLNCQTESQAENALRQVPKELTPLYERMDQHLAETFRSRPQDQRMGQLIMMWVVCAQRPLHLEQLRGMLEYDFPRILDMRQTVRSVCGEFVVVDRKGKVAMVHASAQEFLTTSPHLNYYIDTPASHHDLLLKCVQALEKRNRSHETLPDFEEAFIEYAASYWPYHLNQSNNYDDRRSFSAVSDVFSSRASLHWIYTLACSKKLRSMVEASKAMAKLLRTLDIADRDRSPLLHRLEDKDALRQWSQDLVRIVGQFGPSIKEKPMSVYSLLPAFCPRDSMLHKRFATRRSSLGAHQQPQIRVRGQKSALWGDCLAKFAVARHDESCLPHSIVGLDHYFAILTKLAGTVYLYNSNTCDLTKTMHHEEPIWTYCIDTSLNRIATNGSRRTTVWNMENGKRSFDIKSSSPLDKALAIAFQCDYRGKECLITFSEDGRLRRCSLEAPLTTTSAVWKLYGPRLGSSPHNATFSPDGFSLAISYRGAHPTVWNVKSEIPRLVGQCTQRSPRQSMPQSQRWASHVYADTLCWNAVTNHLTGVYIDGAIFKWHSQEPNDFVLSTEFPCIAIKCSADGKTFATASLDGTLRVWDFEHFTPIYALKHPLGITDLDIDANEARIYDLRDQYCNIWQPSSLLRTLESDISGDAHSSKNSDHPSLASEVQQADLEPVTALAVSNRSSIYAVGGDSGTLQVSDLDGNVLIELQRGTLSDEGIETIVWCESSNRIASVDAAPVLTVWQLPPTLILDTMPSAAEAKAIRSISEGGNILQALFSPSGQSIIIVTPAAVKIYQIAGSFPPKILPCHPPSRWLVHPRNDQYALGLGAHGVTLLSLNEASDITSYAYKAAWSPDDAIEKMQMLALAPRRPSQKFSIEHSDTIATVDKVYVSPDGNLMLIEAYATTMQSRYRLQCLLIQTYHLTSPNEAGCIPVMSVPADIMDILYKCLGFLEQSTSPGGKRPWSLAEHSSTHVPKLHTFCFVDKDFWVCSAEIAFAEEQRTVVVKHFFLPRDWQNSEALDMANVTAGGDFVCPRNGEVVVVSDWLGESFIE